MAKITLASIRTAFASAVSLNSRFSDVETHLNDKVLYRDNVSGEANEMKNDLDMNSNRILNLPSATTTNEPVTYGQYVSGAEVIDLTGTSVSEELSASADGQTLYTLSVITYTQGSKNLSVYRNGVRLPHSSYTETSTSSITLNDGSAIKDGDEFEFVVNERDISTDVVPASNVTYTPIGGSGSDIKTERDKGALGVQYTPSGTGAVVSDVATKLKESVSVKDFGAVGDGVTDDTVAIGLWLDYLIANDVEGDASNGTFLADYISKATNSGIKISGNGIFKATGSNRLNMIRFTGVRGKVNIDGPTFDGNDKVARPLEVQNTGSALLGDVYISPKTRFINAKNNTPDTNTASGLYVFGNFNDVIFEGEIDGVDSTSTSGAVSIGLFISWSTTYWVRNTVVTNASRIRNVKNSNTVTADADGVQCLAPTTEFANFTVAPGALFEECEGRAIKSQVVGNQIDSPVIKRSLYDGLVEINLQYAGGHCRGARVFHDGTRVDTVVGITQRLSPTAAHCSISENELTVTGSPATDTGAMVGTDVTDAAVKVQGLTIRDNKVKGAVDTVVSCRVANVVDVNRVIIDGNWAETVNTAYVTASLFGSARAQLTVVFTNNGAENQCTGGSIVNDLIVEYARGNHNITPLLSSPYTLVVATGVITPYGSTHRVDTEGSASTDDLETITATNRDHDDTLTLFANSGARTVVVKDGVGNINLAGSDMSLDNVNDRITLSFDGTNWNEISRADNGA